MALPFFARLTTCRTIILLYYWEYIQSWGGGKLVTRNQYDCRITGNTSQGFTVNTIFTEYRMSPSYKGPINLNHRLCLSPLHFFPSLLQEPVYIGMGSGSEDLRETRKFKSTARRNCEGKWKTTEHPYYHLG